jgi:DNA primase
LADFNLIKQQVSIAQVLDMLDIKGLTPHGDTLRGSCPCCKEGNNRSFVVTPARNIFYCFSERKGGSVIDLVARFRRIPESQAGQQIAAHFGLNGATQGAGKAADNAPGAADGTQQRKPAGFDPLEYQKSLDPAHAALADCGVPWQTIRDFDGGYCAKGLNRGRLTLPVHDATGTILAFMGIALKGEQPELLFPKGFEPPPFFNLHRQGTGGTLILVQTPMDVLRAWDNGLQDAVCPLVPLTPDTLEILAAFMREKERTELETY